MIRAWIPLLLATCTVALNPSAVATGPQRPNVILILSDDQGFGDFGFIGNERIRTPHLDTMASSGAWLSTFYVTPVCATTRAVLMTGRYSRRTGVARNGLPMRSEERTIAEVLGAAGYATGIFGKWHLGRHHPNRALDQGFEEALTFRGGILRELEPGPTTVRNTDPMLDHNGQRVRAQGYSTDVFFDAALAWIEAQHAAGRNFFAYIPTAVPHAPLTDIPSELEASYREVARSDNGTDWSHTSRVYAMITKLDQNVGKLFARLKALELLDDTLVIYLNDNGPNGGEGNRWVGGLSGAKGSIREGGIRTPLLAHWPGHIPAGKIATDFGAHIDLVPTLLEACGVPTTGLALDGRSLLPLLKRRLNELESRTLYFQNSASGDILQNYAVRTRRWKLLHDHGYHGDQPGPAELYDMLADPLEEKDVAAEEDLVVEALEQQYKKWRSSFKSRKALASTSYALVGGTVENPVLLTKHFGPRLSPKQWELNIMRPGRYEIRYRFAPLEADGKAAVQLSPFAAQEYGSGPVRSIAVQKGDTECVLPSLKLTRGRWRLLTSLHTDEELSGWNSVWQVEIERLKKD